MDEALVGDLMAEGGLSRPDAVKTARAMMGVEEDAIVLPMSERPLIRLVLASAGQWRMGPAGLGGMRPIAIDLVAADVAARWLGITPDARLFDGLAIIEREALKLMRTDP